MPSTLKFIGAADTAQNAPEGNGLRLAERITYQEVKHGREAEVYQYALLRPKGTAANFAVPGGVAADWVVEEATVTKQERGRATCTITWGLLATPPPASFAIVPFEITPALARHAMFSSLTEADVDQVEAYVRASDTWMQGQLAKAINTRTNANLIWRLIQKRRRGQETWYVAGLKYLYTYYLFVAPSVTIGGYRETPVHPTLGSWPAGMSWLRASDEWAYENGLHKVTKTWLGGPSGFWDADIYP